MEQMDEWKSRNKRSCASRSVYSLSSINSMTSLGVHCKALQSFSKVFMVMLLLRLKFVMVYALKPIL